MPTKVPVSINVESKVKKDKDNKKIKWYKVKKDTSNEQDVFVVFDGEVSYKVEKLKTVDVGLDNTVKGKEVVWLGNFQVKISETDGTIVNGVTYKVYLNVTDTEIAYYDGSAYGFQTAQAGELDIDNSDATMNKVSMKYITFSKGDPGVGIIKPS